MFSLDRSEDCLCETVEELVCLLKRKHKNLVGVATVGGDVKFGWVHEVRDEILILKYVAFFSPACPCVPVFSYKTIVPIYQITDILEGLDLGAQYQDALQHIESLRSQEQKAPPTSES